MKKNIMLLGNWRTGTNLLISILKHNDYFDFNEYYSLTGAKQLSPQNISATNTYLASLCAQMKNRNKVLKVNFPHYQLVEEPVNKYFDTKIVLYRSDIFKSTISTIVAEARQNWMATNECPTQPEFKQSIDIKIFNGYLLQNISHHNKFIEDSNHLDVDMVINYERDLVPYINANPSHSATIKSNNYEILNYDEIVEEFQKNVNAQNKIQKIKEYFDSIAITINSKIDENTEIPQFLINILNKNEQQ